MMKKLQWSSPRTLMKKSPPLTKAYRSKIHEDNYSANFGKLRFVGTARSSYDTPNQQASFS